MIVMLTNLTEGGQSKCEQYFPTEEAVSYGPFIISVTDERIMPFCIVRKLSFQVYALL